MKMLNLPVSKFKVDKFNSLKNKIVLVTGSSRGIGRHLANSYLDNKSIVIGLSKKTTSKKIIRNKNYFHYFCDLNNTTEIKNIFFEINKKFKKIDVLVNNAGITKENTNNIDKNLETFEETLNINLKSAYLISFLVANVMKKNREGGTIINVASIGGELGFPNNPAYISSKSGLIGLTRSFARDYGKNNINCNAVLPGYFKTDMNKKSLNNRSRRKKRENLTMLGRWGELYELVNTILFLSTKASKYITGQKIIIDGGIVSKGL